MGDTLVHMTLYIYTTLCCGGFDSGCIVSCAQPHPTSYVTLQVPLRGATLGVRQHGSVAGLLRTKGRGKAGLLSL